MSKATSKPRSEKASAFLTRAERAFDRAAQTVIADSQRLGLKPVAWKASSATKAKK
jgi:hypothetical protein